MAIGSVSPVGVQQFHDNDGDPLAGGKLFFYEAGTTTPTPAYADFNLTTPLSNPVILDAGGRAPQLFLAATSYKQVLQDALGVTLWTADNIVTPTALRSTSGSTSVTGPQHDIPVPSGVITWLNVTNPTLATIDGFSGGTPGQILIVRAGGARIDLIHNTASTSQIGNRLHNTVTSGPTSLSGGGRGAAMYVYHEGLWVLVTHEQGTWITIPHSPGLFTVQGTGSWTVEPADLRMYSYYLKGTSLLMMFCIQTATVTGGPSFLNIGGLPYTFASDITALPILITDPPAILAPGAVYMNGGTSIMSLYRPGGLNFPEMTNTFEALGQFQGNVT